jgi:hypothetical protein
MHLLICTSGSYITVDVTPCSGGQYSITVYNGASQSVCATNARLTSGIGNASLIAGTCP